MPFRVVAAVNDVYSDQPPMPRFPQSVQSLDQHINEGIRVGWDAGISVCDHLRAWTRCHGGHSRTCGMHRPVAPYSVIVWTLRGTQPIIPVSRPSPMRDISCSESGSRSGSRSGWASSYGWALKSADWDARRHAVPARLCPCSSEVQRPRARSQTRRRGCTTIAPRLVASCLQRWHSGAARVNTATDPSRVTQPRRE